MLKLMIPLALFCSTIGCRSMQTLKEDRQAGRQGTEEVYQKSFDDLWSKSKEILAEAGSGHIEENTQKERNVRELSHDILALRHHHVDLHGI